ncbi:MAG: glycoside hydrolase family 3 C-terminal domain-containing protein, partial [Clostridia bacterium]|nr:glycoside hydrolase family 3 C-terminal domain-containing protein [Clostridia bacterium]
YGEDPYLTSRMGVAFVEGLQGDGAYLKAAACAKHFAAHSGPESLRHEFDAQVTQKDLWETYLPAFEALVREAHVEAVMGAYNRTNGEPCCGSKTLLVDILRKKWGFRGHVVSDCWAICDFHQSHMVTSTAAESAALALKNGCDVNCGNTYLNILQAHQDGLISEEEISLAATRLMSTRIRLGLMDDDCPYDSISPLENDTDEHNYLSLEAALKSMVLLKNNAILPLSFDKIKTVAVIGPNADSIPMLNGNYCGTSSRYVTLLEGIRAACAGKARVIYAQGSDLYKDRVQSLAREGDRIAEAVSAAKLADVVVLCAGLDATLEGEQGDTVNPELQGDKADLELPDCQKRLITAIENTGAKVITILASGSALNVDLGDALIWIGYPGQAGGTALARILFGEASPSGKLPITFYRDLDELPPYEDYSMKNRTYRYFEAEPLYPFGFGLSYTQFSIKDARWNDGDISISIENTGDMDGDEVVQVYARPSSPFAPLNPRLCGFTRVHLKRGEHRTVRVAIDPSARTVVNESGERIPCDDCAFFYGTDSKALTPVRAC